MAKRKGSTPPEDKPAPVSVANIPRDPITLAKIGARAIATLEKYEQDVAAQEAQKAIAQAGRRPKIRPKPTNREIESVRRRLHDVANTLGSIQQISMTLADNDMRERESILYLIQESTRSCARATDLCIKRLGGELIGFFDDELEAN